MMISLCEKRKKKESFKPFSMLSVQKKRAKLLKRKKKLLEDFYMSFRMENY